MDKEEKEDRLRRAFVRLAGIKANVPPPPNLVVMTAQVDDYHEALAHLEALGYDIQEFKIPYRLQEHSNAGSYVDRHYFLSKLDAVLLYFEVERRLRADDPAAQQEPWLTVKGFTPPTSRLTG